MLDVRECNLGDNRVQFNGRAPFLAAVADCSKALTTFTDEYKTSGPVKASESS